MNKLEKIYHLIIAGVLLFAFSTPLIFMDIWVKYEQTSQKNAESMLGLTVSLLMAVALTFAILELMYIIPDNLFRKRQAKPGVEHE